MDYPLINRHLLSELRLAHGIFNVVVALLFLYQARLGMAIRRARLAKAALPFPVIKRHRTNGPALAVLGISGYAFGIALVMLSTGNVMENPPHFVTGSLLVLTLAITFLLSRRIRGQESSTRQQHFAAGSVLLVLYLLQVLLGIGVLF